jgi:hypothetical protein
MTTDRKPRKPKQAAPKSDIFTIICKTDLHVDVVKELKFHPKRLWRFDYAIPEYKIAIEVEGGAFKKRQYKDKKTGESITTIGGRHNSAVGFLNDMEKYNSAAILGWRVFRVTPETLISGSTLEMLRRAISA